MENPFIKELYQNHKNAKRLPSPSLVCGWLDQLLGILFTEFSNQQYRSEAEFNEAFLAMRQGLIDILSPINHAACDKPAVIEQHFISALPELQHAILMDAEAILSGDPAAESLTEVIRTYPGFLAIAVHRIAHIFYKLNIPLIPRILSEDAHSKTGIDIHPGATIGERFCIDHGTGVVIGETSIIGNDVKIYQGVTLGALSVRKDLASTKRHPTIEDRVVIYSGATILGGQTIIGQDSIIGGNVWLTKSIEPNCRVHYTGFERQKEKPL